MANEKNCISEEQERVNISKMNALEFFRILVRTGVANNLEVAAVKSKYFDASWCVNDHPLNQKNFSVGWNEPIREEKELAVKNEQKYHEEHVDDSWVVAVDGVNIENLSSEHKRKLSYATQLLSKQNFEYKKVQI